MNFNELTAKLNDKIKENKEEETKIKERFEKLKPLMDEDIELIGKCFAAKLDFPRYKQGYDIGAGKVYYPRKFSYPATLLRGRVSLRSGCCTEPTKVFVDAMGVDRLNYASVSNLVINAGEGRRGYIFYSMGESVLYWKPGSVDTDKNGAKPEPVVETEIIERFCDKFEEMHKDLREWLEKEFA